MNLLNSLLQAGHAVPWRALTKGAEAILTGSAGIVVLLAGRYFIATENRAKRLLAPRAQLSIECDFHQLEKCDKTLVDIRFVLDNIGQSIRVLEKIDFRVFGLAKGHEPAPYTSLTDKSERLGFTDFEFRTSVIKVFSVEAGVKQCFPLSVLLPGCIEYITVKIDAHTCDSKQDAATWFGESRVFHVTPAQLPDAKSSAHSEI